MYNVLSRNYLLGVKRKPNDVGYYGSNCKEIMGKNLY